MNAIGALEHHLTGDRTTQTDLYLYLPTLLVYRYLDFDCLMKMKMKNGTASTRSYQHSAFLTF